MIAIDANIFLRWLLSDDKAQADAVGAFIRKAEKRGEKLWTSDLVIAEVVWVLGSYYEAPPSEVAGHVESLLNVDTFEFENRDRLMRALELYRAHKADFTDCYIVASATDKGLTSVVSFDRDFDKMPITRIRP